MGRIVHGRAPKIAFSRQKMAVFKNCYRKGGEKERFFLIFCGEIRTFAPLNKWISIGLLLKIPKNNSLLMHTFFYFLFTKLVMSMKKLLFFFLAFIASVATFAQGRFDLFSFADWGG